MRRINTFFYQLYQGFLGVVRNTVMSTASVLVLVSCMLILGTFYVIIDNIDRNLKATDNINIIKILIPNTFTQTDIDDVLSEVESIGKKTGNVEKVEFFTRLENWEVYKRENPELVKDFEYIFDDNDSPVSATVIITFTSFADSSFDVEDVLLLRSELETRLPQIPKNPESRQTEQETSDVPAEQSGEESVGEESMGEESGEESVGEESMGEESGEESSEETPIYNEETDIIIRITSADIKENIALYEDVSTINRTLTIVGIWMMAILLAVSTFVIMNTIKLGLHARRNEIVFMRYVGATKSFIRTPFLIEGVIIGVLSAAIAMGLQYYIYNYLLIDLISNFAGSSTGKSGLQEVMITPFSEYFNILCYGFGALGLFAGVISSSISLKKYLNA